LILFWLFIFHFDCLWSQGPSWPWSYGSWIYNYLCNQCLSPLMLWVRISIRARCTTLCDKVCQWLATGRWFPPGCPVSSTNKTDCHDITEILLKVPLNTIKETNKQIYIFNVWTVVLAVYIWLSCLYVLTFYFLLLAVYVLFSCLYGQFTYISLWSLCFMTRHFGGIFWMFKHVFHSHVNISGLDFFF
jgi:hypothetical protein